MAGPFCFSWAGGTIEEQVTLVTNGTTHGGDGETVILIGDVDAGGQQLYNLVSLQNLEVGGYYRISGPGLFEGTYFLFDDSSALAGPIAGSINLSSTVTSEHRSATYLATRSVVVGEVPATMVQGSTQILLGSIDLPAGIYGVRGTGIGQTQLPVPTTSGLTQQYRTGDAPVLIVGSALMVYDGFSGVGEMFTFGAVFNTETAVDSTGQQTSKVQSYLAEQQVTAVTSGQYPVIISGFPDADPLSITGIPAGVLSGLEAGLVYNISGNGIPVGATFVSSGAGSELTLDLPATASDLNAILTITGPRTPGAAFDPAVHDRFDLDILSLEIAQSEGDFATLTVTAPNPGLGLLGIGRSLWCWLSWDRAWTPDGDNAPDLVPLFTGRLVGIPRLQAGEVVELQFLARPDDLHAQKAALGAAMQVLPYYDPIWFTSTDANPDTVLEAYSALWHIDRTSLELTASDFCEGEDGIVAIGEDQAFYDAFSLSYGQPPLVAVYVTGTVTWQQQAEGAIDVTQDVVDAFEAAGSGYSATFATSAYNTGGGGLIQCMCGDGLKGDWPRPGTSIGGGWSLSPKTDGSGYPLCYITEATINPKGGWIAPKSYNVGFASQSTGSGSGTTGSASGAITTPYGQYTAAFPLNVYKIRMTLDYRADRKRTETVTAVVTAGVQRITSDTAEADRETISLTSNYVGEAVDLDGTIPIGNLSYRSYFQTSRGTQSFEYMLRAARAKIRARARTADITLAVGWLDAIGITLRHGIEYTDRRIPGGIAIGKVKSYKLHVGDGRQYGEFTIGCTIGTGEGLTAAPAATSYADDYADSGYQVITGQITLAESDIAYQSLDSFVIDDDGLDVGNLTAAAAVNECIVTNGMLTQVTNLNQYQNSVGPTQGDPINTMRQLKTTVTLDLKPVAGSEFNTMFFPAVSELALAKTIDLGAPVNDNDPLLAAAAA